MKKRNLDSWYRRVMARFYLPAGFAVFLIIMFVLSSFMPEATRNRMGIVPGTFRGISGIVFHPMLHFTKTHLAVNCLCIAFFGWLVSIISRKTFLVVTACSWLLIGVVLWCIGTRNTLHGGASGIVFGYLGFLMLRGMFDRKPVPIITSILTIFFFHGMLGSMFPTDRNISWEGHLSGFLVGVFCAYVPAAMRGRKKSENAQDFDLPPLVELEETDSPSVDERLQVLKDKLS